MKKTHLALMLMLCFGATLAQAQDTTKVEGAKKKLKGKERLLIGLTMDNSFNGPCDVETKVYSPGFNAAMVYDYPLGKSSFSLAGGLGFSSYNLHSNAQTKTIYNDNLEAVGTDLVPMPDSTNYKINKLSLNFVEIPIEVRFRSRSDKSYRRFSLAAGFKVGYLVQSHTKYKDENIKIKLYDIDYLNNLRYGPTFRIGYGKLSLFAFYSLTDMFEGGESPAVTPASFGIFISPY